MATTLRFILLGDDRGSRAFDQFSRSVDRSNRSIAANETAIRRQNQAAKQSQGGLVSLTASVVGLDHAQKACGRNSSILAKGLAAANLATGILEPVMAGLLVTTAALGASLLAAGAGAAAYSVALKPLLTQVGVVSKAQAALGKARSAAEIQYNAALKSGTPVKQAAAARQAALTKAQQTYNAAVKQAPAPVRAFAQEIKSAHDFYTRWADSMARPVLAPLRAGLRLVQPVLRAISPLVRVTAVAVGALVKQLGAKIRGGGLTDVVNTLLPHVVPAIMNLAHAAANVTVGIYDILKAFLPVSDGITAGVDKLTGKFRQWASTLSGHSGFQALMAMFRKETPLANQVLRNLAVIIGNVARATVGLASPANSKALLQILVPLTQVMAQLTRNQQLVRTVLYFLLMKSALNQLRPAFLGIKTGYKTITDIYGAAVKTYGALGRFAGGFRSAAVAESAFSGVAGTLGGKLRAGVTVIGEAVIAVKGWTIWSRIAAVATAAWDLAMRALPFVLIATAIAALVFVIIKYHKQIFAVVVKVWHAVSGTIMGVVHAVVAWLRRNWPLILVILTGPIGLAVLFITRHWHTITTALGDAITWVKRHWPLILAILTGPIGLAVLWIIKHWKMVTDAFKTLWNAAVKLVRGVLATFVNKVLGFFSMILHGAVAMFGWVPGVGGKLKAAASKFDQFRDHVNNAIRGVNGRHVSVGVKFGVFGKNPANSGLFQLATGGPVRGPGTGTSDTAGLFALSNHEYVHTAAAHRHYGTAAMNAINRRRAVVHYPGMAAGGAVVPHGGGQVQVKPDLPAPRTIDRDMTGVMVHLATEWAKLFVAGIGGSGSAIVRYALRYLHKVPYVWGGTTPAGWDCSGFTGWVYRHNGYNPPRTSEEQQRWAKPSSDVPGALVFFYGRNGGASHVGINMGRGRYIGADSPALGTTISSTGGNTGFGIPPGGFHLARGGRGSGVFMGVPAAVELGRALAADYGWTGRLWRDLFMLWNRESGWRSNARNPSSGAAGIPQDITGNMHGGTRGQIIWGLRYIRGRYGGPAAAWAHENRFNWYGKGGPILERILGVGMRTGKLYGFGEKGREDVMTPEQQAALARRGGPRGGDGPLVWIDKFLPQERADVDLLARGLAFGLDL